MIIHSHTIRPDTQIWGSTQRVDPNNRRWTGLYETAVTAESPVCRIHTGHFMINSIQTLLGVHSTIKMTELQKNYTELIITCFWLGVPNSLLSGPFLIEMPVYQSQAGSNTSNSG